MVGQFRGVQSPPPPRSPDKHRQGSQGSISDDESEAQKVIKKMMHKTLFENTMGFIIMFNFLLIILETDITADRAGEDAKSAPGWIEAASWAVLILFIIELGLRIFVERYNFFRDGWNIFDFCVVAIDAGFCIVGLIVGTFFPVSALRIVRLCKLARVSKIFRVFPELRLMMAGLIGSLRAIFWGTVLLAFALLVWSVIAVQFIHPLNLEIVETGIYEEEGCDRCKRAYESVAQSTLTISQQIVAGDSWGLVTVPMIEHYPVTAFYFTGVLLSVGMAVLNLILGVVVNVATQARDDLKASIEDEKIVERMELHGHLCTICTEMDVNQNGELSKDELLQGYEQNDKFRNTLLEMDIQEEDLEILWTILDSDKTGQVSYNTFISHCYTMKISDTQFMLAYIKYYVTIIKDKIMDAMDSLKHEVEKEEEIVASELRKIEADEDKALQVMDQVEFTVERTACTLQKMEVQSRSAPAPKSAPAPAGQQVLPSLPADVKALMDMVEDFRQFRDGTTASLDEIKSTLDRCLKDVPLMVPPQRQPGSAALPQNRSKLWPLPVCCQQGSSQQQGDVAVRSRPPDDVVDAMAQGRVALSNRIGVNQNSQN